MLRRLRNLWRLSDIDDIVDTWNESGDIINYSSGRYDDKDDTDDISTQYKLASMNRMSNKAEIAKKPTDDLDILINS